MMTGKQKNREDGATTWSYIYDPSNRLTIVKLNGTVHNEYYYDADGRRVRLWDSQTGTLTHVYSGLNVIYESSPVTEHIYAAGMHIAENRAGTIEYYHQDHLGSTRLKTNSTGGKVFNDNYKPYGIDYQQSGSEEFKYTGKHVDSSGLYYFGARYYEPETGRFITADSYLGALSDPQSLNHYIYCRNNPQKYTDPDGKAYERFLIATGLAALEAGMKYNSWLMEHEDDYAGAKNRAFCTFYASWIANNVALHMKNPRSWALAAAIKYIVYIKLEQILYDQGREGRLSERPEIDWKALAYYELKGFALKNLINLDRSDELFSEQTMDILDAFFRQQISIGTWDIDSVVLKKLEELSINIMIANYEVPDREGPIYPPPDYSGYENRALI